MSVCFCEDGHYYVAVRDENGNDVPDPNQRMKWDPGVEGFIPDDGAAPHNVTFGGSVSPVVPS